EDVDGEDENGQEGDDEEGAYPRCDFKTIETVSDEKLRELVSLHCVLDGDACHVQVERRGKGTYNFAAILSSSYKNVRKGFVVRIPGHATRAHWNEDDEHAMEREVQLVEHIRKNTTAPVPGILHYSTKHDNLIGFPYILMTQLPGKDAFSIWFDGDDYYNDDVELMFQHADNPSTATEAKRITFLRSLARYMTEIQTLSFEKIGMPLFTDDDEAPAATGPETFTVYHRDLDFQNILVDEDGNITGIIDWDKAFVAPRCIGAAAAPLFLQKDWLPDYLNNLDCAPHMGWKTHYYREIYAAALVEAGNPDAIFATKSAIYRSAFTAFCDIDGYGKLELMDKLLREIPHCRLKSPEFARGLGLGWKDAEAMLKVELAKVLKPELPPHNLLADLDAEMTLKKWYLDFNVEDEDEDEGEDDEDEESEDS
ncbi:kinase-like domain-containing protein, partial [Paraphoma chrysanthemicola]